LQFSKPLFSTGHIPGQAPGSDSLTAQ
jgi:hypothetical protein